MRSRVGGNKSASDGEYFGDFWDFLFRAVNCNKHENPCYSGKYTRNAGSGIANAAGCRIAILVIEAAEPITESDPDGDSDIYCL